MKSVLSLLVWIIISTVVIVTLGILSPTIWILFNMNNKDESSENHLKGHYLQAKTVRYEGERWATGHNDFEPYYEEQISISGRKIDLGELKKIINNISPDLIYDAHILEVYEIATDELLLKISTGHVDGNIHQIVIIKIKVTATANTWQIYSFNRYLDPNYHSIFQSVIPGWI